MTSKSSLSRFWPWLSPVLLMAFSAVLFLRVAPHFLENPGIIFARTAYAISLNLEADASAGISLTETLTALRAEYGLLHMLFLLPVSAIYAWLGASSTNSLYLPYLYYLGVALTLYLLTSSLTQSRKAGLMGALIWVCTPATVFSSSAFPLTAPFLLLAMSGLYSIQRFASGRKWYFLAASLLIMALASALWFGLAIALLLFGLLTMLSMAEGGQDRILSAALLIIGLTLLIPDFAPLTRDMLGDLYESPGFLLFFLLFFLAYVSYALDLIPRLNGLGNFLAFTSLALVAYAYLPSQHDLFAENIGGFPVLVVMLPITLLIAHALSIWLDGQATPWFASLGIAIGLLFATQANLDFYVLRDRFYADFFISISRISSGLIVLGILLYLLLRITSERPIERQFASFILLLLPLTAIFPLAGANYENASTNSGYARAAQLAEAYVENDTDLEVYVCSRRLRDRFWYMTGFADFGQDAERTSSNPFQKPPTDISNRDSGIAIIDTNCDEINPTVFAQWNHLFTFGEAQHRLDFYRILPTE